MPEELLKLICVIAAALATRPWELNSTLLLRDAAETCAGAGKAVVCTFAGSNTQAPEPAGSFRMPDRAI